VVAVVTGATILVLERRPQYILQQGNVKNATKKGGHNIPAPFSSMHSIIFQYLCDDPKL